MHGQKRPTIMLIDDNQANLTMGKKMLQDSYEVYALPSAERLFKFLETVTPDLILLDVVMPDMSGFEVIRFLKAEARYAGIPVIFVTSRSDETDELAGLNLGAADYVTKPFSAAILLRRIENQLLIKKQQAELKNFNKNLMEMVRAKSTQVVGLQNSIINSLAEIVEFRDTFSGRHIVRTQHYVQLLVNYLIENDIFADEIIQWENTDYLISASKLHDLGKIFINETILNKPGKLTDEEFKIMKTHVVKGVAALRRMENNNQDRSFWDYAIIIAANHHEKWDGSGYPGGLKGKDIPLPGRIMAIADVYDALTSARPYKEPLSAQESTAIIIDGAGTHFDPVLVDAFKTLSEQFAAYSDAANRPD